MWESAHTLVPAGWKESSRSLAKHFFNRKVTHSADLKTKFQKERKSRVRGKADTWTFRCRSPISRNTPSACLYVHVNERVCALTCVRVSAHMHPCPMCAVSVSLCVPVCMCDVACAGTSRCTSVPVCSCVHVCLMCVALCSRVLCVHACLCVSCTCVQCALCSHM